MNFIWRRALVSVSGAAVLALIAWPVFGGAWGLGLFSAGLLVILLSHLRNLSALARWLREPGPAPVPRGSGAWEHVFAALHRLNRQRAREQQELASALERFRNAGEAMPDAVVILDDAHHIEWSNSKAQAHFGLNVVRDVGLPILNFIRQPEFVRYLESGDYAEPLLLKSDRGTDLALAIQLIPYGDDQKLLMSRDVTELERVATVRRDFVANVSHELKTPLTVVAGFLETIQDLRPDPAATARYLRLMGEQTRNMQRLVEDLLALSALESAGNVLHEEPVDVDALLRALHE